MAIEDVNLKDFGNLFGDLKDIGNTTPGFGMSNDTDVDLLNNDNKDDVDDQGNQNNQDDNQNTDDQSKDDKEKKDADILSTDNKGGRKPKYDFTDTSGYFQDRFKSGKFVPIEMDGEDGKPVQFIPKTPEEFDEVIDLQVDYRLEKKAKELEENWYATKSPAWQAVAKYAEMTDDPSEILPFLQGVRTLESVRDLDPSDAASAEKIVRVRLQQRGDDDETINEQIDALRTTDKLITTAQKYKPSILQEEQQQLASMLNEKQKQQKEYIQMVSQIRESAIKAIETPLFGKVKLKQDEKAAIYEMIAEPSKETQGYPIYSAIDDLFAKNDMEKLKKIALILAKEDAYMGYISNNAATKTAGDLQTKLRVATDSRSSSGSDDDIEDKRAIQRKQYTTGARFGR